MTDDKFGPPGAVGPRRLTRRHPWRRMSMAGAMALSIAIVGVAGPSWAQGGPPREWGGPHRGGMDAHREPGGAGPQRGGMMFGPGSVERLVNRLARLTDASTDQKQRMNAIAQNSGIEILALRQRHLAARQQIGAILAAPSIDRGKLEAVRLEQMKLADEASKRITTALADIAEVLNPIQRAELGHWMERRHGRRGL